MKSLKYILLFSLTFFLTYSLISFSSSPNSDGENQKSIGLKVGDIAPDIDFLTGIDGDTITLSSLRGKIVLLDFWASFCRPCRIENPNVVKTYNHFKEKKFLNANGFTVFNISLDKDRATWQQAIKDDQLDWDNHVIDENGWRSKAVKIFKVEEIPHSLLIDGDGTILAKNLKGPFLELKLNSLLAK